MNIRIEPGSPIEALSMAVKAAYMVATNMVTKDPLTPKEAAAAVIDAYLDTLNRLRNAGELSPQSGRSDHGSP